MRARVRATARVMSKAMYRDQRELQLELCLFTDFNVRVRAMIKRELLLELWLELCIFVH
jgi:hypothetical protein